MAFPNTMFSRIPLHIVSDEEFRLFHPIDGMLVRKLIRGLGRNPGDAINVVALLMWLERDKLSVNAVYKVLVDWPAHLVDIVADQVVALLEWLNNPTLVWEMRGDISMIQELCKENLAFVVLHQRRLEILQGKREIVTEMSERAFRNAFRDEGGISAGGVGVQLGSIGGYVYHPRGLERNGGVEFAAGPVYGPRGPVNRNNNGVPVYSHELENVGARFAVGVPVYSHEQENIGARLAVGVPVHVPQTYRTYIHHPRTINPNVFRFGTVGEFAGGFAAGDLETVQGHGGPENMNGGGSAGGYA